MGCAIDLGSIWKDYSNPTPPAPDTKVCSYCKSLRCGGPNEDKK